VVAEQQQWKVAFELDKAPLLLSSVDSHASLHASGSLLGIVVSTVFKLEEYVQIITPDWREGVHSLQPHLTSSHRCEDFILLHRLGYGSHNLEAHGCKFWVLPGIYKIKDDGENIAGLCEVCDIICARSKLWGGKRVSMDFQVLPVKIENYIIG